MRKIQKYDVDSFKKECQVIWGDALKFNKTEFVNMTSPVVVTCGNCGSDFSVTAIRLLYKRGVSCPQCRSKKIWTADSFFEEASRKYKNSFIYNKESFKGITANIELTCVKHGEICHPRAGNHLYLGTIGCRKCSKEATQKSLSISQEDFLKKAQDLHGDKYDYSLVKYINMTTPIDILCRTHGVFSQAPKDHVAGGGHGCPACGLESRNSKKRMSFEEFKQKAHTIHKNKYIYEGFEGGVFTTRSRVKINCPVHGSFTMSVTDHLYARAGCPVCRESLGEREVDKYLTLLGISFEREKKFDWMVNPKTMKILPVDFYIEGWNTIIEVDGGQHETPIEFFGGKEAFNKASYRDSLKNVLSAENGVSLIRVNYRERRSLKKLISDLERILIEKGLINE